MKITEINENTIVAGQTNSPEPIPEDRIHSFLVARNLTYKLLELGLISDEEYAKIMVKNMDSFLPEIASLYH